MESTEKQEKRIEEVLNLYNDKEKIQGNGNLKDVKKIKTNKNTKSQI